MPNDVHGHGTLVAGVAAAETNNSIGVASLGWNPKILPVRVLGDNGIGTIPWLISGINYAVTKGAHVLNLSIQNATNDPNLLAAITNAISNGRIVVGITGNDGAIPYPGTFPNVIAVGASDENDNQAWFSNSHLSIAVVAPGVNIVSTYPGGYTGLNAGTSMAAPHVSALAALLLERAPSLTSNNVQAAKHIIEDRALDVATLGFDTGTGWGRIDAHDSLKRGSLSYTWTGDNVVRMISVPLLPKNPDACSFFSGTTDLWWYDTATGQYRQCSQGGVPPPIAAGNGYWAKFTTSYDVSNRLGIKTGKKSGHPYRMHFKTMGWNMFGNPFTSPVPWSDNKVKVIYNGEERTIGQATGASNWVKSVWRWDPDTEADVPIDPNTGQSLSAWEGFWINTGVADLTLVVQP